MPGYDLLLVRVFNEFPENKSRTIKPVGEETPTAFVMLVRTVSL
jgi:hypothetical protein